MRWTRKFEWTNWTFGIWWGPIGKNHYLGIDLGPLAFIGKKPR